VSVSRDDLNAACRLEHRGKTQGTPAYWAKRAADKDVLFASESDSVNDHRTSDSEDSSMKEMILTPAEQVLRDHNARREKMFSHAHAVWTAVYDLHGWTKRVQREWFSANTGRGRLTGPWKVYTNESRDAWFRESFPPEP
jgi:hypothetical protein